MRRMSFIQRRHRAGSSDAGGCDVNAEQTKRQIPISKNGCRAKRNAAGPGIATNITGAADSENGLQCYCYYCCARWKKKHEQHTATQWHNGMYNCGEVVRRQMKTETSHKNARSLAHTHTHITSKGSTENKKEHCDWPLLLLLDSLLGTVHGVLGEVFVFHE